jgi:hypothetical protein
MAKRINKTTLIIVGSLRLQMATGPLVAEGVAAGVETGPRTVAGEIVIANLATVTDQTTLYLVWMTSPAHPLLLMKPTLLYREAKMDSCRRVLQLETALERERIHNHR